MSIITTTIQKIKSLVPEAVKLRYKTALNIPNMASSLITMKRNGFLPARVIDVGAYDGEWTRLCKQIFPQASVLMIEPQSGQEKALQRLVADLPGVTFEQALLGAASQASIGFYNLDTASSVLPEVAKTDQQPTSYLPMTTLDALTRDTPFAAPDFIKLDVQGYEIEILRGSDSVLETVEAIVMEVNLIAIHANVPLFHDATAFMAERGFRVYDICSFFRRPYDGALWQTDVIFVRQSSPLLASQRWA